MTQTISEHQLLNALSKLSTSELAKLYVKAIESKDASTSKQQIRNDFVSFAKARSSTKTQFKA